MPKTSDNDKKARDNQAHQERKNERSEQNREAGRRQPSIKTDHL